MSREVGMMRDGASSEGAGRLRERASFRPFAPRRACSLKGVIRKQPGGDAWLRELIENRKLPR